MRRFTDILVLFAVAASVASCASVEVDDIKIDSARKVQFDITVTREGKIVTKSGMGVTKSAFVTDEYAKATLDEDTPFGLIGIDRASGKLLIDNERVSSDRNGNWGGYFDEYMWGSAKKIELSAYYPYMSSVAYGDSYKTYAIPYTASEVDAGPLVSKTVEKAIAQLNMVPLEFQHITNDIGFKICDATPAKELQGFVHIRKLIAMNVASAGVYIDTIGTNNGLWKKVGYYRNEVVFDGDEKVGVGSDNELFVGYDRLCDNFQDSHRFYSVPDEIKMGRQYVEVVYDIDGFTLNNFTYAPVKNQVAKYLIYGLLPDNVFQYGKQYTFHIGIDISSVYSEITFSPSVSDWETKIYENNNVF